MPLRWLERAAGRAARMPRAAKAASAVIADATALPIIFLLALTLRRGSIEAALAVDARLFIAAPAIFVLVFASLGMYRAVFRFISHGGLFTAGVGVLFASVLLGWVNFGLIPEPITINALVIYAAVTLLYTVVTRSIVREALSYRRGAKERVAIYGAGSAGAQLARALRESGLYRPLAFVDDDITLVGRLVAGVKVRSPASLPSLVRRKRITSIMLALPSCSRRRRRAILQSLESLPVHVRTVPDVSDIVAGRANVVDLREVDANDLLGRDPVTPNGGLLEKCIRGKVVLVTGAGGSIGSELSRQIIRLAPQRLLLLEMSESALYQIDRELQVAKASCSSDAEVIPLLGSALHGARVRDLMQTYGVQTVYHAAAYKHVPMVEHNMIEGVRNNIFSTWCMAEAAIECGVETFVLISTDKAVNPTNVMGATKRFAELTLQALQERSAATRFCMVRFGNVLESSGSVVPLFREQIRRGGPVTVTHKDIIRYFMTIPEASQLVLQAGSMARGGDVFVLDMGDPVRILDLARRMISLMGASVRDEHNPEGDIEIVFTGLRPAEKLYEELLIGGNVSGTEHPMIMRASEPYMPWARLHEILTGLAAAVDAYDCDTARELILQTVAEYRPEVGVQDLVWQRKRNAERERANVTDLRTHRARPSKTAVASLGTQ